MVVSQTLLPVVEIITRNTKREVESLRILQEFYTPLFGYPKYGVYCYCFRSSEGIVVFDPGPQYRTFVGGKGILRKETGNVQRILIVLSKFFPEIPVSYIAASHWHFDHTESAPSLQAELFNRTGITPAIRLHAREYGKKRLLRAFPHSLHRVFRKAGYTAWSLGDPIVDHEKIEGTDFHFIHAPGHTHGNMAIVNKKKKILIAGYWAQRNKRMRPIEKIVSIIDECPELYAETKEKMAPYAAYSLYTYHPDIPIISIPACPLWRGIKST